MGKFFYFGVRQYGVHPTSKAFRVVNHVMLNTFAQMLDNYAYSKTISGKGFYVMRHFGIARGFMIVAVVLFFLGPFYVNDFSRAA